MRRELGGAETSSVGRKFVMHVARNAWLHVEARSPASRDRTLSTNAGPRCGYMYAPLISSALLLNIHGAARRADRALEHAPCGSRPSCRTPENAVRRVVGELPIVTLLILAQSVLRQLGHWSNSFRVTLLSTRHSRADSLSGGAASVRLSFLEPIPPRRPARISGCGIRCSAIPRASD